MNRRIGMRLCQGLGAVLACMVLVPAQSMADTSSTDPSSCSAPSLSQAFLSSQDFNWYASVPGQSSSAFAGTGWTLSGGAKILPAGLPGIKAPVPVLNLPAGGSAVSPLMCVSSDYQQLRAEVHNLGGSTSGQLNVSVSYEGAGGLGSTQHAGNLANNNLGGWYQSAAANLQSGNTSGWQLVQITLSSPSSTSTDPGRGYQVYDLATQASTAAALASVDTSACSPYHLTQAMMATKDYNWYAYAPGVSADDFTGSGWTLSGGATIVSTQLADGQTGSVLNLPNHAKAVSPLMCVSTDYQQLRSQIRSLTDGSYGSVTVAAAIEGTTSWNNPNTSTLGGGNNAAWGTGSANIQPANASGWQLVQFTLTSSTTGKGYQLSNLAAQASQSLALSSVDTSACSQQPLSQPFLAGGDSNWYALAPGESTDSFDGTGWTLSGGAQVVSTRLADGALGSVLDLPVGAQAVSPLMCISTDYQLARAEIQSLTSQGATVSMATAIQGSTTWNNPRTSNVSANGSGWSLSQTVNLNPVNASGWQLVQITLTNTGKGESQLYNMAAQASSTLALSSVDTSACVPPALTQSFLSFGDKNWYTPTPGESPAGFTGTGWTLTGGARIVQGQLANGSTGPVLDLPPGSQAVSPVMCVTAEYPFARAQMQTIGGTGGSVGMYVSYQGTTTWNNPDHSADLHGPNTGWGLSGNANINPGHATCWQLVQITLTPDQNNHSQIDDFEIDPRMKY